MATVLKEKILPFHKSPLFKNSFWGLGSTIIQHLFLSLFFVILARHYSTVDFAHFSIANAFYQFMGCFSALGLGHWFVREIINTTDKKGLTNRFLKMQLCFGLAFFLINIILTLVIYDDSNVHLLATLLGINIIFDNLIYSIRYLNIAEFNQKKNFTILAIEALTKFGIGCLLFLYPLSIMTLTVGMILLRFATLNLFIKLGSSDIVNINDFWYSKLSWSHLKEVVHANWSFVVIGGVSVMYWRVANIIVAKKLTLLDVANYEISFKLFSIAQIIPIVISTTVFPALIKLYNEGERSKFQQLYKKMFKLYWLYGVLAYTFLYCFADFLLPFVFSSIYSDAALYTKQMFLTILVFPTGFLQANILISMKLEKFDMWFNLLVLLINLIVCLVGLHYMKSLSVVIISLFVSFVIFHILQDVLLIKRKITNLSNTLAFYLVSMSIIFCFTYLYDYFQSYWILALTWGVSSLIFLPSVINVIKIMKSRSYADLAD